LYKIPANTLFLGKQLVFVPECHSTNTLALQLGQENSSAEGMVVVTANQTAGRGQMGNRWEAQPGMNLTFSVIFKPSFLRIEDQFMLNIMASLAVRDFLLTTTGQAPHIKWPNDVLVHDKKICGILIENHLQGSTFSMSVVGIGLNVNQMDFESPKATSVRRITNSETDLEEALHSLLTSLEARYLELRHRRNALRDEYHRTLYWLGEPRQFRAGHRNFNGVILGVDETGRLMVESDKGKDFFSIKEIEFVS